MRITAPVLSCLILATSFSAKAAEPAKEAAPAAAPGPAASPPVTIQWKFEPGQQYVYSYEKSSSDAFEKRGGLPPAEPEVKEGDKAKEKKKDAKPAAPPVEKKQTQLDLAGTLAVIMEADAARMRPDQSVKSMKKDGKKAAEEEMKSADQHQKDQMAALDIRFLPDGFIKGDSASDAGNLQLTLHALLPVPSKPLAIGQPLEEEVVYNFKELQPMRGKAKWELKSVEEKEGRKLASYHLGLDLKMDEDTTKVHIVYGRPSMTMTVEADVVFDLAAQRIESVQSEMKSSLYRKKKEKRNQEDPGVDSETTMNMEQKVKLAFQSAGPAPKIEEAKPSTAQPVEAKPATAQPAPKEEPKK